MRKVYLDYASLTPVDPRVLKAMKVFSSEDYSNPSALYASAVSAKEAMREARTRLAKVLHAHADEIYFTASGTEANNLAIRGVLEAHQGTHLVVSAIEHSSIIETARALEKKGIDVTYVRVDSQGLVDLTELKKAIKKETTLVSVMMVNNELGVIEPLTEVAKIVRETRKSFGTNFPLLHTDACQAPVSLPVYIDKLNVDLLTLDGHKVYGPRGIGLLYRRRGVKCSPLIFGGSQENGLRAGTENLPAMQGLALALEFTEKNRGKEAKRLADLKQYFLTELQKLSPEIKVNSPLEKSVPHILNVTFPKIDSEFFVLQLDAQGIACSTKSACLRDEAESYVLKAIGTDSTRSVRFSFGQETSKSDLKYTLKIIAKLLA